MTLEPHLIYLDGKPLAITVAKDADHAVESFRAAALGQGLKGTVTAQSGWTAPFEDVMRVGLLGLYMRIFQGDMAAAAAAAAGQRGPRQ